MVPPVSSPSRPEATPRQLEDAIPAGRGRAGLSDRLIGDLPRRDVRSILTGSTAIVGSQVLNSGFGFLFWWLAARGHAPAAVGVASAIVSVMLLVAKLTTHGLGTSLTGALAARPRNAAGLFIPGLVFGTTLSAAVGIAAGLLASSLSQDLAILSQPPVLALFTAGVALTALGSVLDQGLVGLLRSAQLLTRNVAFSVGKLLLLGLAVALGGLGALGIVGTWIGGEILSLVLIGILARSWRSLGVRLEWDSLGQLKGEVAAQHSLNVARLAPALAMPLVVTAMFSAETNAAFYLAYMIANGCQLMAGGSTNTLYAAAVRSPKNLTHQMRLTLLLSFSTVVPAILALMVFGSTIMGFFGSTYAASASSLLPALASLALPLVIRDHWIALARIRRQTQRGARIIALSAGLEMLGAIGGGLVGGLAGLSVGWLLALTVAAVAMAPTVLRAATRLPAVNTPPSRSIAGSE